MWLNFQYFTDVLINMWVFFYLVKIRKRGETAGEIVGKMGVFEFDVNEFTFCV